jgi:hypothetical protein
MSNVLDPNSLPAYPEVDISLLSGTGEFNSNSPGYPEIDISLLPGVPNQSPPIAYKHVQTASSQTWVITHNLNFYPNITVMDSAGNVVEGDIVYTSKKVVTLHFSAPVIGYAVLS